MTGGERLADRAYTGIVQIILDEQLAVGDRLPAEDKLATMFGMSRTIVREALARLASDGITQARRGLLRQTPPVRAARHAHVHGRARHDARHLRGALRAGG